MFNVNWLFYLVVYSKRRIVTCRGGCVRASEGLWFGNINNTEYYSTDATEIIRWLHLFWAGCMDKFGSLSVILSQPLSI